MVSLIGLIDIGELLESYSGMPFPGILIGKCNAKCKLASSLPWFSCTSYCAFRRSTRCGLVFCVLFPTPAPSLYLTTGLYSKMHIEDFRTVLRLDQSSLRDFSSDIKVHLVLDQIYFLVIRFVWNFMGCNGFNMARRELGS
jgi:hypothetical protein